MLPFVHSELPFMHRGIEKYKDFVKAIVPYVGNGANIIQKFDRNRQEKFRID